MRSSSHLRIGLTLTTLVSIALVFSGCTSLFSSKSANRATLPPPADVASAPLQPLSAAQAESCVSALLEPERSQLLQQALSDGKLQAVKAQLERRGVQMNAAEAMALKLPNGEQLLIPFGATAHLVWTRANGQTAALGLVRQGHKTLNLAGDGSERVVRMLEGAKVQRLLGKLRETAKFREFEQRLREKGKRLDESKLRVLLDETGKTAIVGLVNEDSDKIVHQLRIRLKANKDDEPEQNAEPQIQPTACGQASGEAVASAATLQPQELGDFGGGWGSYTVIDREMICTSQWGYLYSCYSTTPRPALSDNQLQFATFVGGQGEATLVVWNAGGGTLTGSVSTSAPFSIVSGGSFSLMPGQPQEIVVRFAPTTTGDFTGSLSFSSGTAVALTGKAYTFEEYLEALASFYNQLAEGATNSAETPALYVPSEKSAFVGFEGLSKESLDQMIRIKRDLQSQPAQVNTPATLPTVTGILEALQELRLYLSAPDFAQQVERIKTLYPNFAQLLTVLAQASSQNEPALAYQMAQTNVDEIWARFGRVIVALLHEGIIKSVPLGAGVPFPSPNTPEQRYASLVAYFHKSMTADPPGSGTTMGFELAAAQNIANNFLRVIEHFLQGKGLAEGVGKTNLLINLLNTIPGPKIGATWPPIQTPDLQTVREFVRFAQLLGNMIVQGSADWKFYEFRRSLPKQWPWEADRWIDFIATAQVPGFREGVTVFARAFDFTGAVDTGRVIDQLNAVIDYVKNRVRDYPGTDIAVGFIGSLTTDADAQAIMNGLANPNVPVLLVYCVANCNSFNPTYRRVYRGMSEQQANALACSMGFLAFCSGYNISDISYFSSLNDAFSGKWQTEVLFGGAPPPPEPIEPRYNPVP